MVLRLREDDDKDEITREDEPFKTPRAAEAVLLREVFLDALGQTLQGPGPAAFRFLYDLRTKARARRGLLPIGLFGDVESRRHLNALGNWYHAVQASNLLEAAIPDSLVWPCRRA